METKTYIELIENNTIIIPEIQRDYAQGRKNNKIKEIRNNFLNDLIEQLTNKNESTPMVLDFIYGSTQENKSISFIPLDGQQRLTTLFLLHWYLKPDDSTILRDANGDAKFTYYTRISSKDFCNELVKCNLSEIKSKVKIIKDKISSKKDSCTSDEEKSMLQKEHESWTLSKGLMNQNWFAWSWRQDPTIKSMLVMLDAMDEKLSLLDASKMWEKLSRRAIVFHLLYLHDFNLSDELYVKMNARGKELSDFDIFKSTLEQQMRLNNVKQEIQDAWCSRFDSSWMDIFWNRISKDVEMPLNIVENVEKTFLRFLRRMMVFHLYSHDDSLDLSRFNNNNTLKCDELNRVLPFEYNENDNLIDKVREYAVRYDIISLIPFFNKTEFFNDSFFSFIIDVFENITYQDANGLKRELSELIEGVWFEQNAQILFDVFLDDKINYDSRVQYYAILKFAEYNKAETIAKSENLKNEFNSWMRVIRNLTTNTNSYFYNTWDDFNKSINGIDALTRLVYEEKQYESVVAALASDVSLSGFDVSQMEEERTKAKLMFQSANKEEWVNLIRVAEEHKYLLGQIRFLLEWADENTEKFESYYKAFDMLFDNDGVKSILINNFLFKNALMCLDKWYLLNSCFMYDTGKHRDCSWKRYLRESARNLNVKHLLDEFIEAGDAGICNWIKSFIAVNKPTDWRKCFIEYPQIYDELYDKKISWWYWDDKKSDGEISLLSKTRWSSRHKELRTYYWYLKFKNEHDTYTDSTSEYTPFTATFTRETVDISVQYRPLWDNGRIEGEYVINNATANDKITFKTGEYEKVEAYLHQCLFML